MAVRAITGKYGDVVDRMELECQRVDNLEPVVEQRLAYAGGTGGNTATYAKCAGRAAMVGLTGQSGDRIDRLGGMCMPITSSSGASPTLRAPSSPTEPNKKYPYMMTAWGGTGGNVGELPCGAGRVLVGIDVWYQSSGINGIGARCATPAGWFAGSEDADSQDAYLGRKLGTGARRDCARDELMVGWKITTGTFVDGVEPICRAF